jgi:hypothetical protein
MMSKRVALFGIGNYAWNPMALTITDDLGFFSS